MYFCPHGSSFATYPTEWGAICNPGGWAIIPIKEGREWIADNGCYSNRWDEEKWADWLGYLSMYGNSCRFAVCPDKVASSAETTSLWHEHQGFIRSLGLPIAFVCQDGQVPSEIPECDAIFIGGSTVWKLSPDAIACIREAQRRGIWTHVGRVNSQKRFRYFLIHGADSYDGTSFCFGPDINGPRISRWHSQENLLGIR